MKKIMTALASVIAIFAGGFVGCGGGDLNPPPNNRSLEVTVESSTADGEELLIPTRPIVAVMGSSDLLIGFRFVEIGGDQQEFLCYEAEERRPVRLVVWVRPSQPFLKAGTRYQLWAEHYFDGDVSVGPVLRTFPDGREGPSLKDATGIINKYPLHFLQLTQTQWEEQGGEIVVMYKHLHSSSPVLRVWDPTGQEVTTSLTRQENDILTGDGRTAFRRRVPEVKPGWYRARFEVNDQTTKWRWLIAN